MDSDPLTFDWICQMSVKSNFLVNRLSAESCHYCYRLILRLIRRGIISLDKRAKNGAKNEQNGIC